jgi:hypothetical protein
MGMLDRRSRLAKDLLAFRSSLTTQVGGEFGDLNASQRYSIDLACSLKLKLMQWDQNGDVSNSCYVTTVNSLSRLLTQLEPKPGPQRPGPKPRVGAHPSTSKSLSAIVGNGNGHGRGAL